MLRTIATGHQLYERRHWRVKAPSSGTRSTDLKQAVYDDLNTYCEAPMSEVKLVLRDATRDVSGTLHGSTADHPSRH